MQNVVLRLTTKCEAADPSFYEPYDEEDMDDMATADDESASLEAEAQRARAVGSPPEEAGDGDNVMTLTTEATWEDDGDTVRLSYEESELSGMEGTRTVISYRKSEPTLISITRQGSFTSVLMLEQGKLHTSLYESPAIPLSVSTLTHYLKNDLPDGTLRAEYTIGLGKEYASRNSLRLDVRFPEDGGDSPLTIE